MIQRTLAARLQEAGARNPVVTVTGPRQSGKTTLCRALFPELEYVSLEPLDRRAAARGDPRGFLSAYGDGAVLDEIQNVPELASYLQPLVDEDPIPGRWILTGSQHLGVTGMVAQSLAGRSAVLELLPLGLEEVRRFPEPPQGLLETLFCGGFPRIHDRGLPAAEWLAGYVRTYIERDVRQIQAVSDLTLFQTFLRLVGGRTGSELNWAGLASDVGVSAPTIRSWLGVLEASFLVQRAMPWFVNIRKRFVKSPKLHILDSGLVCHLLGLQEPEQLRTHPLRGAVFESWAFSEILKARVHAGCPSILYHLRQVRGREVDIVVEGARRLALVEVKSSATVHPDSARALSALAGEIAEPAAREGRAVTPFLIHGGDDAGKLHGVTLVPWYGIQDVEWAAL